MKKFDEPRSQHITFEELLDRNGVLVYTNVGYSMMPLLRQRRDLIEIRKKGPERCKKYDVVLYKRKDRYILHRILKVCPDGYIIAGDNTTTLEYDINDNHILGVMKRIQRNGKEIRMDNKLYMLYVHLWCDFYPIRMFILRCKQEVLGVLSKIKRLLFPAKQKRNR